MKQNELSPAPGARKNRKRVGRGDGSGHGSYSGKGCKGQKSRSGAKIRPGFEGGQLPLIKRLPKKRGFFHLFKTEYAVVNLKQLNHFQPGSEVTPEALVAARIIKNTQQPIKVLADGEIDRPLVIKVNKASAAAKAKVEAAGGKIEVIGDAAAQAD